jgi:hypothetical protein
MMRVLTDGPLAQRLFAQTNKQRRWRVIVEWGLLLALLVGGALAGHLARGMPPARTADLTSLGARPAFDLAGMNIVEQNTAFGYTWSTGYTLAQLRNGYNAAPFYQASVRMRAANPAGPQPLTFLANERPLATVTPATAFRTYHLMLPAGPGGDSSLRFAFQTQPFSPPGDPRQLGVILTDLTLAPLPSTDWPLLIFIAVLLAALAAWLRWRGASFGAALLICAILLAALLTLYGRYLPAPLGFGTLAACAIGAAAIGGRLAPETAGRLGLAALAVLMTFSGMIWPSWLTDDAFISFRYAQNLVAGNGLVYNVGERVEGYTNFLWTLLAALAIRLGGDLVLLSYAAGVVIGLALLLLTYWLGRRLLGPAWGLVAALVVATSQSVLVYTGRGSGLETGLFALLALAGAACAIHPRAWRLCGIVFALATLTRPEGALLMGLTALWLLVAARVPVTGELSGRNMRPTIAHVTRGILSGLAIRRVITVLAGYLLIVAPYFFWRATYYGELLPNTFYAKTGGGISQVVRGLVYAGWFLLALGGPLALAGFVAAARDWRMALRDWRGYFVLLIGVYSLYVIAVGGDHFPGDRFFVPLVPLFALTMAGGLARLYEWIRSIPRLRMLAPAALAVLLVALGAGALIRSPDFNGIVAGDDESLWIWRELGWWFHDHGQPGESMAALGAGAVAFYSDRPIVDLLGLTDKHIARVQSSTIGAGTAGHEKRDPLYVLDVRRPTYIPQIWDEYFGGERGLRDHYTLTAIRTRYGRELKLWKRVPS